ncbi:hypothetical protein BV20DRAFT_691971 [Pilatotrama ljubarskyi]|nr:hypothetical protein BV20DRAFT_691971 [Pilatotrama ljubarskyi]
MTTPDPLPTFKSSARIKNCIALAYSTKHNPRSLEAFWYPPYTQTISEVFDFSFENGTSTLSVADRFYLGLSYEDLVRLEVIEDVGNSDPEDNKDGSSVAPDTLADTSFRSIATVADGRGKDVFPDFMVAHIRVIPWPEPGDKRSRAYLNWKRRHGAHACHMCCMLIGEVKRAPSRTDAGRAYDMKRQELLETSAVQLIFYLSINFAANRDIKTLIGVRASGPWWSWRIFQREEIPDYVDFADVQADELGRVDGVLDLAKSFTGGPFYLGEQESDREWERVREKFVELLTSHAH